MLSRDNIQDIYGLAPMQEAMLIQHARDPASAAYVEQFDFELDGELDAAALQRAFDALVARYDVLRTVFSHRRTDRPRQIVLKARAAALQQVDFTGLPAADVPAAIEAWKVQDRARGFDLSADMVLRLSLLRVAPLRHRLVMGFHHIALDGWCLGTLFEDLLGGYERAVAGGEPDARRAAHPYREYIRWVEGQDRAASGTFWAQRLAGYEREAGVPFADIPYAGPAGHAVHGFSLGRPLSAALAARAAALRLTLNSIFQTAWGVLLQKYQHADDVVFGSVVSGRPAALAGVEQMVGLFINTVPMRVASQPDDSFAAVAARVQQQAVEAMPHEFLPLFEIQARASLRNRLLDHIVAFENYPIAERVRRLAGPGAGPGLRVTAVQVHERTSYDFNVIVHPGEDIAVSFNHHPGRYDAGVVAGIERSLRRLLEQIAADPATPVGALRLCAAVDEQRILNVWNDTAAPYPRERAIPELFLQAAQRHADAIALRHRGRGIRYAQLQRDAAGHARALRERGVRSGDRVALLLPRGPELVCAMLAVLSLGAAYVPLDAAGTAERMAFVLDDADVVLTCALPSAVGLLPEGAPVYLMTEGTEGAGAAGDGALPLPPIDPCSVAYIMYTSGSTGQPKGCAVTHRNIARLVCGNDYLPFDAELRILMTGAPAFDASTFEVWGALLHGGRLCLVDDIDILDAARLARHLADERITTLWLTTALFNQLCDADLALFAPLRHLLVGGDVLSPRHIRRVREAHPGLAVINGYGPTENTTFSTTWRIDRDPGHRIPIGRPIRNATAYVLDAALNLLPPGAYGELCVGGDGVALGYVKRPALSAERFVADPFRPGGRLYRTGDIVRWLPDGSLDMRGRDDQQVKLRGFRVELGEVERALGALPGVSEAAVRVHEGPAGKQLHAWYAGEQAIAPEALRAQLAKRLASYMLPVAYQHLRRLPLTANGKLDRRALPPIDLDAQRGAGPVTAPRSALESRIAEVVQAVLGLDRIDIHENFFELGASSLNLITIHNRLREALAAAGDSRVGPPAVTALFEHPSVARLAEHLTADADSEAARQADEAERLAQARRTLMKSRTLMRALEEQS